MLFGGAGPTAVLNDTWTFLRGVWAPVPTPVAPSARLDAAMTYDAADGYVLLFGGTSGVYLSSDADTWAFSAGVWSDLYITGPPARDSAAMTYDSEDGYVLLFGGENSYYLSPTVYNDTWTFQAGAWTNLTGSLGFSPATITGAALVDDTYDGHPILYGGFNSTLGYLIGGWVFSGTTWYSFSFIGFTFPTGRVAEGQFVYDPALNSALLFGGAAGFTSFDGDTWTVD